ARRASTSLPTRRSSELAAIGRADPLDGGHLVAVRLHGEHQAGPHGRAVEEHRARAADAVLAPQMGPGELAPLAEEVGERQPRFRSEEHTSELQSRENLV